MKASITLYRAQRRRLERQVHKSSDALLVRRILAILYLADGQSVSAVARRLAAARSSVGRWRALWQSYGEAGLTTVSRRTPGEDDDRAGADGITGVSRYLTPATGLPAQSLEHGIIGASIKPTPAHGYPCLDRAPLVAPVGIRLSARLSDIAQARPAQR